MNNLNVNPNLKFLFANPAHFFGLGFGSGLAPKAPGTFGTLMGLPLFWLMSNYSIATQLVINAVLFVIGIYFCAKTGKALNVPDHGAIVWDEIVAIMLVLTFTPMVWQWWIVAFLLFRLFDIWKPYPICYFDVKLKNGFGVMLDDLLAALYSILSLKFIVWSISQL